MRYRLRTLLIGIAIAGLAFSAVRQMRNESIWEVRGTFTEIPWDDMPMEAWLKRQPGVYNSYVYRSSPPKLTVYWQISYPIFDAAPPNPDVETALLRFGYKPAAPIERVTDGGALYLGSYDQRRWLCDYRWAMPFPVLIGAGLFAGGFVLLSLAKCFTAK
jgi:hypothetical protein